jgi:hypothetical protein
MLAELNRFFANELGIDAIVGRPWLTRVAMPVLFAFHDFHQGLQDMHCNAHRGGRKGEKTRIAGRKDTYCRAKRHALPAPPFPDGRIEPAFVNCLQRNGSDEQATH